MEQPKTMVHVLHEQATRHEHRPALWKRRGKTYVPTSWREYAQRVTRFALGLQALGFAAKGALAIQSFNREEWLVADLAAIALGGVPVGIYTTSSADQIEYILQHSEAEFFLVENAKYLEGALKLRERLPRLRHIIVMDPPETLPEGVLRYSDVLEKGTGADEGPYWERVNALEKEGLASLIYTSGTTGNPKGVMLSHHNMVWTAEKLLKAVPFGTDSKRVLSYLPLSHIAEQMLTIYAPLMLGVQVFFADSLESVPQNLKEVRPTFFFGVPRVWEKFKAKAEEGFRTQPALRQKVLGWARGVATEYHTLALRHEKVPLTLEAQYQLARRLVFSKLHERIGFDQVEFLSVGAALISREVLDFFASIDVIIREVWGMSEVTGPGTLNTKEATRLGSVGRPLVGVEVRIAEDGEILVRGGNVCLGYFKEAAATAELLQEGWLHTGDVGVLDGEGFAHITGRKKEIIVTSGGKKTAPSNIELMLKSVSPVSQAVVIGERRNYLVALLTVDAEKLKALAREKGWPEEPGTLVRDPQLRQYLEQAIERDVNPKLSKFETIKRIAILPEDFSIDGGEMTPTLKVRRSAVEKKHAALIESLYAEGSSSSEAKAG
ncbi:long-chain fatty acid--CoA ligase [Hyalangium sp.]|uniref:AMP-dependent synthetase/ligase n=1 Tax=Hyalangium sp. TaxID=2028555 RepID=UPI002D43F402|nr:long-chain fatty acid--CoA ligase [Hyalangium sp.]HYH94818.1 long-chain fatty acid--CoA ligase [Hyalangium sp.]